MLNLEEILVDWENDSKINDKDLSSASLDTALLHAKYLKLLSLAKLQSKKSHLNQKTLLKDKWLYYNNKMSKEEIDEHGWDYDPFKGLKIMKSDMHHWYDTDKDIQKSEEKVTYYKTLVETLQEMVETLRWRHQTIGNIIKWKNFEAGG